MKLLVLLLLLSTASAREIRLRWVDDKNAALGLKPHYRIYASTNNLTDWKDGAFMFEVGTNTESVINIGPGRWSIAVTALSFTDVESDLSVPAKVNIPVPPEQPEIVLP